MRTATRLLTPALALGCLLALATPAVAGPVIDDFTTGLTPSAVLAQGGVGSSSSNSQAVGFGSRVGTVAITSGAGNSTLQITGGNAILGTAGDPLAATITLDYTFSAQDFSSNTSLDLNVSFIDDGSTANSITVEAFLDNGSGLTSIGSTVISATGPLSIPFGATPRDQTVGISLKFNLSDGDDIILNSSGGGITLGNPIPEPASMATFAVLGVAGLIAVRRRKAKAAA